MVKMSENATANNTYFGKEEEGSIVVDWKWVSLFIQFTSWMNWEGDGSTFIVQLYIKSSEPHMGDQEIVACITLSIK